MCPGGWYRLIPPLWRLGEGDPVATTTETPPEAPLSEAGTSAGGPLELAPPSVHLNIEVHIPADASAAQIDQIFSIMARHIKANSEAGDTAESA